MFGNVAMGTVKGSHDSPLTALKFARSLGVWFHRTYGKLPAFTPALSSRGRSRSVPLPRCGPRSRPYARR